MEKLFLPFFFSKSKVLFFQKKTAGRCGFLLIGGEAANPVSSSSHEGSVWISSIRGWVLHRFITEEASPNIFQGRPPNFPEKSWDLRRFFWMILLMVQKSGVHQLRLVVEIPLFTRFYTVHPRWCRISSINSITSYIIHHYHIHPTPTPPAAGSGKLSTHTFYVKSLRVLGQGSPPKRFMDENRQLSWAISPCWSETPQCTDIPPPQTKKSQKAAGKTCQSSEGSLFEVSFVLSACSEFGRIPGSQESEKNGLFFPNPRQ